MREFVLRVENLPVKSLQNNIFLRPVFDRFSEADEMSFVHRISPKRVVSGDFRTEVAVKQKSFGLPIYLNATRSGEGTAIFRRPKSIYRIRKYSAIY